MKTARIGLALALVLSLATSALAQDSETRQRMQEVLNKASEVESYRVNLKMETEMMGQSMVTQGEMAFKKPNKMHMKTISNMMGGMVHETYTTGDIIWTHMPAMKMVTKVDISGIKGEGGVPGAAETADITRPFEGFPEESIKFLEKKTQDQTEYYVFEAKPSKTGMVPPGQPTPQMLPHKIVFWINSDTGLPHKVTMLGEDGSRMIEQTYYNFRLNVPIDDSEFEFTPPEDAQVMDMTEATVNMMKQMRSQQRQPIPSEPTEE